MFILRPHITHHNMTRLIEDIDDLDRMVDRNAQKDAIRAQIRLVGREVAALEADHARLAEDHEKLQAAHLALQNAKREPPDDLGIST